MLESNGYGVADFQRFFQSVCTFMVSSSVMVSESNSDNVRESCVLFGSLLAVSNNGYGVTE